MTRGDRVRCDMASEAWPDCVVYPHGRSATVLEVVGNVAILAVDNVPDTCNVLIKYLEVIDETRS